MIINHNLQAVNTHRNMGLNNASASKNMEKLSSGLRINRAADDAAGLSISEKMRGQIRGLEQAQRNVQDGVSFAQTAEGAMNEVSAMLTRMKELNVQKSNGTYSASDKSNINAELNALGSQIDAIMTNTKFNGISIKSNVSVQADDRSFKIQITGVATTGFSGLSSATTLTNVSTAIENVAKQRSNLGA
ncbi:flagellin, partial [Saccharibacillus kuerlensis]